MKYLRIPLIIVATVFLTLFASVSFGDHENPSLGGVPYLETSEFNFQNGAPVICQKPAYGIGGKVVTDPGAVEAVDVIWYCISPVSPTPLYCLLFGFAHTDQGPREMWGCDPSYHKAWKAFVDKYGVQPNNPVARGTPV